MDEIFDMVVIGGGSAGLGVAGEAARRGLRTLLLERDICGRATSDGSLRIMHGGFRYLQTLNLRRVWTSLVDQTRLLEEYPEFVHPFPCLMPLAKRGLKSSYPAWMALGLYRTLAGLSGRRGWNGAILSPARAMQTAPNVAPAFRDGALLWEDALLLDPRTFAERLIEECREAGGMVQEHTAVLQVSRGREGFRVETSDGNFFARVVANCAGGWLRRIAVDFPIPELNLVWWKAFNLLLREPIDLRHGIGLENHEGRLFFFTPRPEQGGGGIGGAAGTWYRAIGQDEAEGSFGVEDREISEAVDDILAVLPGFAPSQIDVCGTEAGVLPAYRTRSASKLYGSEQVLDSDGYIEVLSTKYTTFRHQAGTVLKKAGRYLEIPKGAQADSVPVL